MSRFSSKQTEDKKHGRRRSEDTAAGSSMPNISVLFSNASTVLLRVFTSVSSHTAPQPRRLPKTECYSQSICWNMLLCMSCLIIGPSSQLTALILRRRFTLNISSEKLTGSAADFSFARQNPPQKTYKTLPLLLSHHRRWRSVSSFYENLWLWPEKLPWGRNESEKEHAHPADNDKRGEVNQVNAKTLNRTNHSVLPVHLFTVPTDLILSHTYAGQRKRPRHRADSTQHGRSVRLTGSDPTDSPFSSIVFNSRPSGCCKL